MRLSCNFVNVYMIAYRVHVYTRTSLIHPPNPNPDSSNRISPIQLNSVKSTPSFSTPANVQSCSFIHPVCYTAPCTLPGFYSWRRLWGLGGAPKPLPVWWPEGFGPEDFWNMTFISVFKTSFYTCTLSLKSILPNPRQIHERHLMAAVDVKVFINKFI